MDSGPNPAHDQWNRTVAFLGAVVAGIASVAIVVTIIWGVAASQIRDEVERERHTAHYAESASKQIQERCEPSDAAAQRQCIEEIVTTTHEHQRAESDLQAQWKMADWAYAMVVISGFSFLATIAGIYFVRENLKEMQRTRETSEAAVTTAREANEHARKALSADRPWMVLENFEIVPIASDLSNINLRTHINFTVILKNVGRSPATGILIKNNTRVATSDLNVPSDFSAGTAPPETGLGVSGPGQESRANFTAVPLSILEQIWLNRTRLFLYSDVEYHDIWGNIGKTEITVEVIFNRPYSDLLAEKGVRSDVFEYRIFGKQNYAK